MSKACPDLESLAGAPALPQDHPLRRHLDGCSRCRAAARALEAFRAGGGDHDLPRADLEDADRRLGAVIAREVLGAEEDETVPPLPNARRRTPPRGAWGWLAAAAVVAVAAGLWLVGPGPGSRPDDGGPLRGEAPAAAVAVTADPSGGAQVSWPAVAGADDYVIELWTAELALFSRLAPAADTTRRVTWDPAAASPPVFLTVVARQGDREIGRTDLVRLP